MYPILYKFKCVVDTSSYSCSLGEEVIITVRFSAVFFSKITILTSP